jgi:hypothetical protein
MFEFPKCLGLDLPNSLTRHTRPPVAKFLGGELTFTTVVAEAVKLARDPLGWMAMALAASLSRLIQAIAKRSTTKNLPSIRNQFQALKAWLRTVLYVKQTAPLLVAGANIQYTNGTAKRASKRC